MIFKKYTSFLQSLAATLVLILSASVSHADEYRLNANAVVELFTSQGCASCPLADKVLANLAKDENIIALAYHVDYWDYIGWSDTFGSKANSKLQEAYSKAQNNSKIYTPQIIINGTKDIVGSRSEQVKAALLNTNLPVSINFKKHNNYLTISIAADASQTEATVWLVTFISKQEVKVTRGENRGKTLSYTNIVTQRRALGMWQPNIGANIKLPIDKILNAQNDGLAIIVQNNINGLPSKIIASAAYIH